MHRSEKIKGFWWGQAAGTRALRRPRHRWEDNIKVGLTDTRLWREGDH